jgi:putative Mn2+ efflux pump MntP
VVLGVMTFVTPMGQETMTRGLSGALHLKMWMGGVIAVLLGGWFIWRSVRLMKQAP